MNGGGSVRVENEAVPVRPRLVSSVRRYNQQGEGAILKLVAHFCDRFRVTSSAIVHALSDELDFPHTVRKEQAVRTKVAHLGTSLAEYWPRAVRTGQTALRPELLDLRRILKREQQNLTARYCSNSKTISLKYDYKGERGVLDFFYLEKSPRFRENKRFKNLYRKTTNLN